MPETMRSRTDTKHDKRIYLPDIVGKGYGAFWRDKSRYRVLKGGKGSKKSTTTALNYLVRLMDMPESNLLVVRNVYNTHRDSTFATLRWAMERLGVSHLWSCTTNPLEMVYRKTGQKILFRGFDDALKLASITVPRGYLNFVWIEEAYEIESEQQFDLLDLSVPRARVPEGYYNQTTLTFNPWSETHWLKRRFFDTESSLVTCYTTTYDCNEHLSSEFFLMMDEMRKNNYRKFAVAGLGEWGIAEGLIYDNFEVRAFDRAKLGIEVGDDGTVTDTSYRFKNFFGLDYGYSNDPTAFICMAVDPIGKVIYIFDEHYETKMLNSDIARMITGKGYRKEIIRADAAEPKSNDELRRLGLERLMPSVKGKDSIINGIAQIQEYKIIVHPRCENTVKELSSYCWKKDKTDNGINVPEDRNNHLMDAMRYAFYDVRFFDGAKPVKRRPSTDEYYDMRHGIDPAADMGGDWI